MAESSVLTIADVTRSMQTREFQPGCIRTVSGQDVSFENLDPDTILMSDIAWALSHMPRFGGHLSTFYSVAQHSIEVCRRVSDPALKFQALMHDASEAYLVDIPTPLKAILPGYRALENRMMSAIAAKYMFSWPVDPAVKAADTIEFEREAKCFMRSFDGACDIVPMSITEAYDTFLEMAKDYQNSGIPQV